MAEAWNSPEWKAYAAKASDELVRMVSGSAIGIAQAPRLGEKDIQFATELGLLILLDKPILVLIEPGQVISEHLRRVADRVVEVDLSDEDSAHLKVGQAVTDLAKKGKV